MPRAARRLFSALAWSILPLALGAGCAGTSGPSPDAPPLEISFVDACWNGVAVPLVGRCRRCGGEGMSPALKVANLPPGATAVVVEFNDRSYQPLSTHGGHGAVRMAVDEAREVTIPSFRENTESLPAGVSVESRHRATGYGKGVYLGPCGCGSNNYYEAVVKAVGNAGGKERVLAQGRIQLGQF